MPTIRSGGPLPHQMAPPEHTSNKQASYYSFIDLGGMKGWVGLAGWPVADGLPKQWSPVGCRPSAGQGHAVRRPNVLRNQLWPWMTLSGVNAVTVDACYAVTEHLALVHMYIRYSKLQSMVLRRLGLTAREPLHTADHQRRQINPYQSTAAKHACFSPR